MRNLLEEFNEDHGLRPPTILGVRGHIFIGIIFGMAHVKLRNKFCDNWTKGFGYSIEGDKSKASRGINLSEDIFVGFNLTLRQGNITHYEYISVGKGHDVGLNQISMFETKVSYSNGEKILGRDICHLGHRFDFFRMLSYYTIIGFYVSSMMVVIVVHLFLYGKPYLSLSRLESSMRGNNPLKAAMSSQSAIPVQF
ncbi:hypothetical protein IEQ34_006107 [Dendrobium chrysotoxum]|uniref:Glycosyl transferase 48 domain-containing protein n=1 Tax=Dendrobium chrysotoxum TaxID=161865 RepID=A0AAV7GWV9_DENCH|nr:hypothetical protein IEQ34_006107 [Dendrobium chrysotoxum]